MGIRDLTKSDLEKINQKLQDLGANIKLTPKLSRAVSEILPTGLKLELEPKLKLVSNEALAKAVEGKVMKVQVTPLLTHLRKALKDATVASPPEIEVGVQATKLRTLIESVLNKHGFMINISTVNDNYTKVVQQQLNGRTYKVVIHADAREISRSVQASLMQVQSRYFGLQVSKDILRNSIDQALIGKPFQIQIAVMHDQARRAVQNALNNARMVGKDDALAYQRLMSGELKAAQAELARLKAAHMGAADAAKAHASASINLGGAMGSNIKIAGELGSAMASLYSIHAARQFLSQIVEIGGELEHQKIAMDTIFGDKGKTNELFGQIKGLARQSPFGVMELTSSVKQLSAYGVEYNEIYDTAKRLADISAATSVDINRLILAFGKTKSRGFLDGLEAKQFAYANIPIYEMVRKKLEELEGQAVTTADVMKRMKKREIGFDIVKDVLWDMTDEGGKFYNMQEALAGSVKTSWKLVRDNIELMFGEIAESSVGGGLKNTAEVLQTLTRNWQSMATVIGTAAAVFGIYKISVAASNSMMGTANATTLAQRTSQLKLEASTLSIADSYRALTVAEYQKISASKALQKANSQNIFTNKALASWEIRLLYTSQLLNKDMATRLIAMGRISPMQAKYLIKQGLISRADLGAALAARAHGLSIKILGKEVRIASFRFKMLAASIASSGKALLSMLINPATLAMAAIGGAVYAWQKNEEQMEEAKNIGDNIFTKASEGANNLKQTLEEIKSPEGLSEHELTQGIEKMEQAIKDYSPQPLQDINNALVDQNGHVLSLAERYESLKKRIEEVGEAYRLAGDLKGSDIGNMVTGAIESTGGLLNDTVIENAKDLTKALKEQSDAIRKYTVENPRDMQRAVEEASKVDEAYRKAIGNMKNTSAKFRELFSMDSDGKLKYGTGFHRASLLATHSLSEVANKEDMKTAIGRFDSDIQNFIMDLTANIRITWGKEIKDLNGTQKDTLAIFLKNMIEQAEGVSGDVKMRWAAALENAFGITIIEDKIGPALKETFISTVKSAQDASIIAVVDKWKNEGWNALSDAERKVVADLMTDAKTKVLSELGITHKEVQDYLTAHPLRQIVQLSYSEIKSSDFQKEIWNDKLANRLSEGLATPSKQVGQLTPESKRARAWYNSWSRSADGYKDAQEKYESERKVITDEIKAAKNASKEWLETRKKMLAEMDALAADMGLTRPKEKGSGRTRDTLAEELKAKFKDLKDAWAMYKNWQKSVGDEAAFDTVANSGLFKYIEIDEIPRSVEAYDKAIQKLQKQLEDAGVKGHPARESLLNEIIKTLFDLRKSVVDEQLKLALDKVSKEAERQLENWNLYDKVRKATGNKQLAFNLAFGIDGSGETDYVAIVKKQFEAVAKAADSALTFDTATPEKLAEAPEEVRKAWEKANGDILKYFDQQRDAMVGILTKYQSLQDKIAKIDSDRNDEIEKVNANKNLTSEQKAQTIRRINVEADYEKFTKSNEYLQFFNDIYGLTMDEANRIGDLIQLNLNQKLQAGLITIYDYEKEMEKVRNQLESLRNVKSDAMTFFTSGLKGLNKKRLQKAEGELANNEDYQKALADQIAAQNALNKAKEEGNEEAIAAAEAQLALANQSVKAFTKIRDAIIADQEKMQNVLDFANIASGLANGLSDAFNSIKDMAEALGADTESGIWADLGAVMDTLTAVTGGIQKVVQSAMNGDIGGILSGAVSTLTTPFTIWATLHDKKLQKMIEHSKEYSQQLQYINDAIERRMESFLGNRRNLRVDQAEKDAQTYKALNAEIAAIEARAKASGGMDVLDAMLLDYYRKEADRLGKRAAAYQEGGAYGYQRQLMTEQLEELEKQKAAMEDMKKKDPEAIADITDQIDELTIKIRDFAEEMAKSVYGIDLSEWAEQIGDALVDAFAKGEDAAEAFDKTVGDIMRSLVGKMITQDLIAPMFDDIREYLFGENGIYSKRTTGGDFKINPEDAIGLAEKLKGMMGVIEDAKTIYDQINEATDGMLDNTGSPTKSGLTAGIQALTENTGDLLASYINGMRGDVSVQTHELWPRLLDTALPQISVIAQSQLDAQRQIAEYTRRNAEAAEAIVKSNNDISRLLARVTQGTAKFYIN